MQLQLPEPGPDALQASKALQSLIADEIGQQGGWISFARYMELALYAPGLGYYSGGAAKLGKDGDFTTAPEITPLFGKTLAQVIAQLMQQSAPQMLEFGAGTGRLAFDILTELKAAGVRIESYAIVELSGELRSRQQDLLREFAEVRWLDRLPEAFSGVVLGNEVLDAMPVHLVAKNGGQWCERGLVWKEGQFAYEDRPCAANLIAQIPDADQLPDGYLTEVHPHARAFMASLAAMLLAGGKAAAILIDYGFPAAEYYLGQRDQGTLMCHYRHHSHPDPLYLPGLQDITSHVDFTAMAQMAQDGGTDLLAYTSQAAFLLAAGLGEILMRSAPDDAANFLPQTNAVQRLTSPAEMGELFKVLVIGTGLELSEEFARSDRSHRL
ncbi:MAG TPA: SAM-dependent methyltransferase [Burkholderiaceae bacterium]|jgi:SAM-dependent MidA family methyltransferase